MSLDLVDLKNNVLSDYKINDIKIKIVGRLNELGINLEVVKSDLQYLALVCNLVEHLCKRKDKMDKKLLVTKIYKELTTGLSEDEEKILSSNIDYIHSNNQIKKASYYKLFKCMIKEYCFKKR
jgi:hypothetical protein